MDAKKTAKSISKTSSNDSLIEEIRETNRLLKKSVSRKYSFIRGIWVGLGTVVGGTLIIAAIIWVLSLLKIVPVIGGPAEQLLKFVEVRYDKLPSTLEEK